MRSTIHNIFNVFIIVYVIIASLYIGSTFFYSVNMQSHSQKPSIPSLSVDKISKVSILLEKRVLLISSDSADIVNYQFGKDEPFNQ